MRLADGHARVERGVGVLEDHLQRSPALDAAAARHRTGCGRSRGARCRRRRGPGWTCPSPTLRPAPRRSRPAPSRLTRSTAVTPCRRLPKRTVTSSKRRPFMAAMPGTATSAGRGPGRSSSAVEVPVGRQVDGLPGVPAGHPAAAPIGHQGGVLVQAALVRERTAGGVGTADRHLRGLDRPARDDGQRPMQVAVHVRAPPPRAPACRGGGRRVARSAAGRSSTMRPGVHHQHPVADLPDHRDVVADEQQRHPVGLADRLQQAAAPASGW